MKPRRRISAIFLRAGALLLLTCVASAQTPALHQRAIDAVRQALAASETSRVALLDSALVGNRLTLNFNRELLDLVPGSLLFEQWSRAMHVAAADALRDELASFEIYTLIAGVPLHHLLGPADRPPIARLIAPPSEGASPARTALAGRRVALSPGHGYYLNASSRWVLQRDFFSGIVEDFVNHDLISLVERLLVAGGADVRPTRNLDRNAGTGESGFPKWQEAARYHVKTLGAADSVWNEPGFDHISQDIRCRPLYANAVGAELLVSVHNNGGGGTGTETLYDTNHSAAAESKRLADLLHARVIAAIRRDYNPTWADRRVQGFNGNYGENRLATRAAVIIEIAFMDRPTPDNLALRDERFKQIVATAIRDGISDFLDGANALLPGSPAGLIATSEIAAIALAWTDTATNETGFRMERKAASSSAWTTVATLAANATAYRDTTVTSGASYLYRVQALNGTLTSPLYSNEATATTLTPPLTLVLAAVIPTAVLTRDWDQTAEFNLTVTDTAGQPVIGASLIVSDRLRNIADTFTSVTAEATGRYTYRTTVPAGQADGSYSITFQAAKSGATSSAVVTREVSVAHFPAVAFGVPSIYVQPLAQTVTAGTLVNFVVQTSFSGPPDTPHTYQWFFNGSPLAGATRPGFTLPAVMAAQAGAYSVVVRTPIGSVTSLGAPLVVAPTAWLSNVSLRTTLAAGQNVIVGFVVAGGAKDLLVRAAGPALLPFGLTAAMTDPRLELYRGTTRIADNNDWPATLAPTMAALGAFPFPTASRDAALLQSFDGAHTVQAGGNAPGVVLVEGYDAGRGSAVRLINVSARNRVGIGSDILIAGFFLAGTGTQRVLIRAVGPALTGFGVTGTLADPRLEVHDATGRIAEDDNWAPALAPTFAQVGAFALPTGSKDSALLLTLAAGRAYTAQVSGIGGTTGEALVEVYEVP